MAVRLEDNKLFKSSRVGMGRSAHHHIIYINPETGAALVSVADGHTHQVQPLGGNDGTSTSMVSSPSSTSMATQPGGWFLGPAEDGHTHEVAPYEPKPKKEKADELELTTEVFEQHVAWTEMEGESINNALENEKIYCGEQWDAAKKQELASQDRAALVINVTEKQVDTLSGYQRNQRSDLLYAPVEGGDQLAADMFTVTAKNILGQCYFEREESKVFEDTVITGRGLFNMYVDFNMNLQGDIKVEKFPWDCVRFAPHEKEDLSDCEGLIKEKFFSLTKLKQLYPDKADELEEDFTARRQLKDIGLNESHVQYDVDQYRQSPNRFPYVPSLHGDTTYVDIRKKEYRVLERWLKVYNRVPLIVNLQDDFVHNADGWSKKDLAQIQTLPGFVVTERAITQIRITRCAGGVLLSDENPADLPVDDFFIIPVYAKKRGAKFWGKVQAIKDPQLEINKRHSQTIDIGNKMCAYLYYYDDSIFALGQEQYFKDNSSRPGAVVKLNDINRRPVKEEGVKFPAELVQLMEMEHSWVQEMMNIQPDAGAGANTSGSAILQRERAKLTSNQYLFDNLSFAKVKLGRLLLKLIQKYWSPEDIYRLVASKAQREQLKVGGQDFTEWPIQEVIDALTATDIDKFDVVVTEASYNPTTRMATFIIMSDLAQKGLPIPPDILVELADFPESHKQRILAAIQQQQGGEQEAASETKLMEENKTLINQGIIPPEVEQRLEQEAQATQQPQGFQGDGGVPPNNGVPSAGMQGGM